MSQISWNLSSWHISFKVPIEPDKPMVKFLQISKNMMIFQPPISFIKVKWIWFLLWRHQQAQIQVLICLYFKHWFLDLGHHVSTFIVIIPTKISSCQRCYGSFIWNSFIWMVSHICGNNKSRTKQRCKIFSHFGTLQMRWWNHTMSDITAHIMTHMIRRLRGLFFILSMLSQFKISMISKSESLRRSMYRELMPLYNIHCNCNLSLF